MLSLIKGYWHSKKLKSLVVMKDLIFSLGQKRLITMGYRLQIYDSLLFTYDKFQLFLMMTQNGQFLNSHNKLHTKQFSKMMDSTLPIKARCSDMMQSFERSSSDISQELIKELTTKNQLLNAQLSEYRTLVNNFNQLLRQAEEQIRRLKQGGGYRLQSTQKLHTIQQEINSLGEITTKSRRRDCEQVNQQYYFFEISQLLNAYGFQSESISWQAYLFIIEQALHERKTLNEFAQKINEMKQRIQPGDVTLMDLWKWLKKIGGNYHYLLSHTVHKRNRCNSYHKR